MPGPQVPGEPGIHRVCERPTLVVTFGPTGGLAAGIAWKHSRPETCSPALNNSTAGYASGADFGNGCVVAAKHLAAARGRRAVAARRRPLRPGAGPAGWSGQLRPAVCRLTPRRTVGDP